jgi:SAM-dependent methyltransferase
MRDGARVLRAITAEAVPAVERLLAADWLQSCMQRGDIPESQWVDYRSPHLPEATSYSWIEHQRLSFPIFPHELCALQLHDAAELTLALAIEALDQGWVLKDASAWNVLFDRGRPVFCDLLSFEPFEPTRTWMAYAQFQRCFTIPLLVNQAAGIAPRTWFLCEREGLSPESARRLLPLRKAWRQPALEAVTLPVLFHGRGERARASGAGSAKIDAGRAKHVLRSTLQRLGRHVRALKPSLRDSTWLDYQSSRQHYQAEDLQAKAEFVRQALAAPDIHSVLDLGCNTGEYSVLAASLGKSVVAVDGDEASVQRLYDSVRGSGKAISPMVLNIARPSPALGWMNLEVASFVERATGGFDCVMALGLIHHLLVTERATLEQVVELLLRLTSDRLLIEWVSPQDPRFRQLAGPNWKLYESLDASALERLLQPRCALQSSVNLPSAARTLSCWRRHPR